MIRLTLLFILLSVNFKLFACEALPQTIFNKEYNYRDISLVLKEFNPCSNFMSKDFKTKENFTKAIDQHVQKQTDKVIHIKNRHVMGKVLNTCVPTKNSKALFISFAGTGAHNPRSFHLLSQLIKCPMIQNIPSWMKKNAYNSILKSLKQKKSSYTKWSGIQRGLLSSFITNSQINDLARNFDYATFPSEKFEILTHSFQSTNFSKKIKDPKSYFSPKGGVAQGITDAVECIRQYTMTAKKMGVAPKIIMSSHSSGGRSAVQFLEQLEKEGSSLVVDLHISLDPVKEAHKALREIREQTSGTFFDALFRKHKLKEREPLAIYSRNQPNTLYKHKKVKRLINFYQNSDSEASKEHIRFGIQGSPIYKADENHHIDDTRLGKRGHGTVTFHPKVLERSKEAILKLFE